MQHFAGDTYFERLRAETRRSSQYPLQSLQCHFDRASDNPLMSSRSVDERKGSALWQPMLSSREAGLRAALSPSVPPAVVAEDVGAGRGHVGGADLRHHLVVV